LLVERSSVCSRHCNGADLAAKLGTGQPATIATVSAGAGGPTSSPRLLKRRETVGER